MTQGCEGDYQGNLGFESDSAPFVRAESSNVAFAINEMKASPHTANPANRVPLVANAVLRCTREDSKAAPLFERINEVPGLWVLELSTYPLQTWPEWLSGFLHTLTLNEAFLRALKDGSTDYTLHLKLIFPEWSYAMIIPPSLSGMLASCGITIELSSAEPDE